MGKSYLWRQKKCDIHLPQSLLDMPSSFSASACSNALLQRELLDSNISTPLCERPCANARTPLCEPRAPILWVGLSHQLLNIGPRALDPMVSLAWGFIGHFSWSLAGPGYTRHMLIRFHVFFTSLMVCPLISPNQFPRQTQTGPWGTTTMIQQKGLPKDVHRKENSLVSQEWMETPRVIPQPWLSESEPPPK